MSDAFDDDVSRARELLAADDLTALHLGVIHEDETVDTVASRRTDGDFDASLQALSLLATHIRAVATEAGAEYEKVAADAAAIAAQLEELPVATMDEPPAETEATPAIDDEAGAADDNPDEQ